MVWHVNEGVTLEKIVDENRSVVQHNKKFKADVKEIVSQCQGPGMIKLLLVESHS